MNITTLATDLGLIEGPVIRSSDEIAVVSIDRGKLYRVTDLGAEVLAVTGAGPNGAAESTDGTLFIAQNGGLSKEASRWPFITGGVQIVRAGGKVDWLTQDPISPNDLCFGPDGFVYVTDPTRNGRFDDGRLWRCDPLTGESELLSSVTWYPNGIGFGQEDDALYVASSGDSTIKRFPLTPSGLGRPEVVIQMATGLPDGIAFDAENNIVIAAVGREPSAPGSIQTWTLDGTMLDELHPGSSRHYTNVALSRDSRLIVTDGTRGAVLAIDGWPLPGLALHPFRGVAVEATAAR